MSDAKTELAEKIRLMMIGGGMDVSEAQARITLLLNGYSVTKEETALTVYDGGKTEYLIKRFLGAKIANGLTRRSIEHYRTSLRFSFRQIGKSPDAATSEDISVFLAKCLMRTSKANAQNYRRSLSSFYAWMDREELYPGRNPMYRVDNIKVRKKQKQAFTDMDIEKLYAACRTKRETAMVAILLSTGCRLSEVIQIRFADIENDEVTIVGKGEKERTVFINAKAKMALERYREERSDENPYVFPRMKGNDGREIFKSVDLLKGGCGAREKLPLWYTYPDLISDNEPMDSGSFESIIRNIGKRAGVENVHPHRFRRTCATMALRRGMPLALVSKMLGHESIATTQIYLDIDDGELKSAHSRYVV